LGLTVRLQPDKPLRQQAGSPGYWAPEVASRAGTYVVSDLWSWGVLLYEMLAGARPRLPCDATRKEWSPFSSDSAALAADPSAVMVVGVPFDEAVFGASARDLLSRVLEPDPRRRLGATRGAAEVREHPFFKGLDWERLEALELEPLFKPADRTVHAPALDQVSVAEDKEVEAVELTAEDQAKYADFEYVSLRAVQHEFLSILVSKEEKRREEAAARRRRVQAQAQAAAAKIKAAAAAPSDSSDAQTGAAVSLPPTIMSAKGKRGVCCVVS
jgi:serine/threonine protein kinase